MNPEPTDFVLPVRAVTPRIVQPSEEVCCFKTCELHVCGFQAQLIQVKQGPRSAGAANGGRR